MDYTDLNQRQAAILDFIKMKIQTKGYPPSVREICEAVNLSSPSTVHSHLATLEKKGYIRRDAQKPRAMEVIDQSITQPDREMINVPIVGKISAGLPALAEENIEEYFPIPFDYIHSNHTVYMLKVSGESMIEAGIYNNDYLIVEEASTAQNGEIVVALVGDDATVKTFYKEKDRYRLQPENSSMEPIYTTEMKIIGKPIGLFRRF